MFLKGYFGLILFGTVIVHLSSSESVLNCLSSSVRYKDQTNRNWVGLTCPAGKHIQVTDYRFVFEPDWREVCTGNVPTPNNECSKSSISLLRATINNCNGKDSCDIPYDFTSAVENEVTPETTGSCSIDGGLSSQPGLAWSGVVVFYDCIELAFCSSVSGTFLNPVLKTPGYPAEAELSMDCECRVAVADHFYLEGQMDCQPGIVLSMAQRQSTDDFTCTPGQDNHLGAFKNATIKLKDMLTENAAFSLSFITYDEDTRRVVRDKPVEVICKGQVGFFTTANVTAIAASCAAFVVVIVGCCCYCHCRQKIRRRQIRKRMEAEARADGHMGMQIPGVDLQGYRSSVPFEDPGVLPVVEEGGLPAVHSTASMKSQRALRKQGPGLRGDPEGNESMLKKKASSEEELRDYAATINAQNKRREEAKLAKRAEYTGRGTASATASRTGSAGNLARQHAASTGRLLQQPTKAEEAAAVQALQGAKTLQSNGASAFKPPKYSRSTPHFDSKSASASARASPQPVAGGGDTEERGPSRGAFRDYNHPFPHGTIPNYHPDDNDDYPPQEEMTPSRGTRTPLASSATDPRLAYSMPGTPGGGLRHRYGDGLAMGAPMDYYNQPGNYLPGDPYYPQDYDEYADRRTYHKRDFNMGDDGADGSDEENNKRDDDGDSGSTSTNSIDGEEDYYKAAMHPTGDQRAAPGQPSESYPRGDAGSRLLSSTGDPFDSPRHLPGVGEMDLPRGTPHRHPMYPMGGRYPYGMPPHAMGPFNPYTHPHHGGPYPGAPGYPLPYAGSGMLMPHGMIGYPAGVYDGGAAAAAAMMGGPIPRSRSRHGSKSKTMGRERQSSQPNLARAAGRAGTLGPEQRAAPSHFTTTKSQPSSPTFGRRQQARQAWARDREIEAERYRQELKQQRRAEGAPAPAPRSRAGSTKVSGAAASRPAEHPPPPPAFANRQGSAGAGSSAKPLLAPKPMKPSTSSASSPIKPAVMGPKPSKSSRGSGSVGSAYGSGKNLKGKMKF